MSYRAFVCDFRRAYEHRGGLKSSALGSLDPLWFEALRGEMSWVIANQPASLVTDKAHTSNWAKPVGVARQFSLFNPTGRPDEYLSDFAPPAKVGKKLVFPELEATTRFAKMFGEQLWNLRLLGLGRSSKLSLHEENPIEPQRYGMTYKLRFHLPVFTGPGARMLIDGESFHYDAGVLYFFHHGCVHAAVNDDETPRYHLVLDCLASADLYHRLFPGTTRRCDPGYQRLNPAEARATQIGEVSPVDEFVTEGGQTRHRLDYGRRAPGVMSWYRKAYPSAFRPLDRILGVAQ